MATTSLFVEILVIGSIAEIWIALFLFSFVDTQAALASPAIALIEKFSTLLLVPLIALTYVVGWAVNFLAERLFKLYFQAKFRDLVFERAKVSYREARSILVQNASEKALAEMEFDRHILRITRGSALNFSLIAIVLLSRFDQDLPIVIAGISVSLVIAVVSFFQWLSRYRHSYSRILDAYKAISSKTPINGKSRKGHQI